MKLSLYLLVISFTALTNIYSKTNDTIKVGYTEGAPFIYKQNETLQGPLAWLWDEIAEENEYHFDLIEINADKILVSIDKGEIDLAIFPLSITSERLETLNFSVPFYLAHSGVMTKNLSSWDQTLLFLKTFFSLNFFRALGALALVILIFGFLEWLFERKLNSEEFGGGVKGLWSGFWWSAVTMTTVGYGDKSPKTTGGRVVALIWMFAAIMIISGFTASIASSLTVTELGTASDGIEDFKERKIGTVENSATHKWLKDNFFKNKTLYPTKEELIQALENDDIEAAAYDLPLLKEMQKNENLNDLRILEIRYNPQYYALGMNTNVSDSLRKEVNTALLKATESYEWSILLAEYGLKD
ncbi:MAG: transporter substrate-binding domain-containing protein [Brumimicrobium sp.]